MSDQADHDRDSLDIGVNASGPRRQAPPQLKPLFIFVLAIVTGVAICFGVLLSLGIWFAFRFAFDFPGFNESLKGYPWAKRCVYISVVTGLSIAYVLTRYALSLYLVARGLLAREEIDDNMSGRRYPSSWYR
jgi:hypothetical protein